jgi:hypothetical protein
MNDHLSPESTRREGVPTRHVRLSDGAEWGFMRPSVLLRPKVVSDRDRLGRPVERLSVEVGFGYPAEIRSLIDTLQNACEGGSALEQYDAFFSLSVALLRRTHEIDLATACGLLSVSEEELPRLVRDIVAVITESNGKPVGAQSEVQSIVSR